MDPKDKSNIINSDEKRSTLLTTLSVDINNSNYIQLPYSSTWSLQSHSYLPK